MPTYTCQPLPQSHRRLLQLFYKEHGATMRPSAEAELWVARDGPIIAGLCLRAVCEGHWLTSLFVAPAQRGQGVSQALVEAALEANPGPTWLFCEPALAAFYARLGFVLTSNLPEALGSRLNRYQRSKSLIALVRDQSSATSSPGNSTSV